MDPATTALVSSDPNTVTNAANRDYAVPLYAAVRADRPFLAASSGYAGTASDGLAQLDADRTLTTTYEQAPDGNVVQTGQVDVGRDGRFTLALGFGQSAQTAIGVAGASARAPFERTARHYVQTWREYDQRLRPPPSRLPGLSHAETDRLRSAYWLSANVLKASEDKTFPGAVVASLASPWGQAVSAGDTPGGNPVYFGSYREVFARDLYESFTGLMASGDLATARATVRFLFERQQLADGRFPRNSLVNGKLAPDTGGDQLDETAYPILMAYQAGLQGDRRAVDRPRTEGGGLRRLARPVLRVRAVGGAGRLLAVHHRRRDRRAGRRRPDRRRERRPRDGSRLPRHRRPLPAQHQGLDGHHHRSLRRRAATSSACRRTATPTRRSPTGSATAARPPTSAPSSTPASSS